MIVCCFQSRVFVFMVICFVTVVCCFVVFVPVLRGRLDRGRPRF